MEYERSLTAFVAVGTKINLAYVTTSEKKIVSWIVSVGTVLPSKG